MIDVSQVLNKFSVYTGITDKSLYYYEDLCKDSLEDVIEDIRENIDIKKHTNKICCIAAALAFYRYILQVNASDNEESMALGSLKVSKKNRTSAKSAYDFYYQMKTSSQKLFKDNEFFVSRVEII